MIATLATLATLVFIGVSVWVGARLLLLARRTRGLPEALLGFGLFAIAGIGYPLLVAGRQQVDSAPDLARWLIVASTLPMSVGWSAVWVFTWKVFRPASPIAATLVALAVAGITACMVGSIHVTLTIPNPAELDFGMLRFLGTSFLAILCYVWAATESFHYWGMMRKRVALDLADPVVCNRFLLFGCVMVFSAGSTGVPATASALGIASVESAPVMLAAAAFGLCTGVSLWLAFLPPKAYLARLRTA